MRQQDRASDDWIGDGDETEGSGRSRPETGRRNAPPSRKEIAKEEDASCNDGVNDALDFTLNCSSVRLTCRDTSLRTGTPRWKATENGNAELICAGFCPRIVRISACQDNGGSLVVLPDSGEKSVLFQERGRVMKQRWERLSLRWRVNWEKSDVTALSASGEALFLWQRGPDRVQGNVSVSTEPRVIKKVTLESIFFETCTPSTTCVSMYVERWMFCNA